MTASNTTLADKAYQLVEEMIVTLKLAPGQIFSEATLGEELGVGRTPLREALKKMAAEQLVTPIARRGIQVVEIKITDQIQLLETRRVLDKLIVQRAAKHANPIQRTDAQRLGDAIFEAATTGDLDAYMRADYDFGQLIANAAKNRFAAHAVAPLNVHSRRFWYAYRQYADWLKIAENHQALALSIAEKDGDTAEQLTDELIDYLLVFTKSTLEEI